MNQEQNKKPNPFLIGCLGVLVLVFVLFKAILNVPNEQISDVMPNQVHSATGIFQDKYSYTILWDDSKKYTATFVPQLPKNDQILLDAYLKLVEDIYGTNKFADTAYMLVELDGANVIKMINATDGNYYFYPIKEDTGLIHTIVLWRN